MEIIDIKEKVSNTKLKLLAKINEKLESPDLTAEEMKDISTALSTVISFSDYADKIFNGFDPFRCATTGGNDKKIN